MRGDCFVLYNFLAAFERWRPLRGGPLQNEVLGVGVEEQERAVLDGGEKRGIEGTPRSRKGWLQSLKGKEGEQAEVPCG